ncbi:MAG: hypothetical protein JW837_18355 [Sedimentisphaerales bacterium]|nr:hypothetical protein [Sedimentisphaerales bacterium]
MIGTDSNHCRIVAESLVGEREVDERTFSSLSILHERLERLKKIDGTFSGIEFSPEVEKLQRQKNKVAVG